MQNLFTTINKLKYFLNSIQDENPPLYYVSSENLLKIMVTDSSSVLKDIQDVMIENQLKKEATLIEKFMEWINASSEHSHKMFLFRLCCLCIGHMCLYIKPTERFNSTLVGDVTLFYAFTHTYFTSYEYRSHVSEEIRVALQ